MDYHRRLVDDYLDELLPGLPAIALEGPKGVGKTATGQRRAQTTLRMDDPQQQAVIAADPSQLLTLPAPILVDEWQRFPSVWDMVRRAVDDGAPGGQFILTGSSAPLTWPAHSGAGRIVTKRMRPLSLAERDLEPPVVSLGELFKGARKNLSGQSELRARDYAEEIVCSGFPGIRGTATKLRNERIDAYLATIVRSDFPEQGLRVRRPDTLTEWLRAYSAATATTASYEAIMNAATPGVAEKPSRPTTTAYRDVLSQLWLLDALEPWLPGGSTFSRLARSPKHFLADPALAARLWGLGATDLLRPDSAISFGDVKHHMFGPLFEHLVALSVHTYASMAGANLFHLRLPDGAHEVDLIVAMGQRVVAIEVKLSPDVSDRDVRHLVWLRNQIGDRLADALVVTTGTFAYR